MVVEMIKDEKNSNELRNLSDFKKIYEDFCEK